MALCFLHLRDGTDQILDPDGTEYPSVEAMREDVLACARDLISADVKHGVVDLRFRIDVEDEGGAIVYTLPFKSAFSIIPEA